MKFVSNELTTFLYVTFIPAAHMFQYSWTKMHVNSFLLELLSIIRGKGHCLFPRPESSGRILQEFLRSLEEFFRHPKTFKC